MQIRRYCWFNFKHIFSFFIMEVVLKVINFNVFNMIIVKKNEIMEFIVYQNNLTKMPFKLNESSTSNFSSLLV